MRRPVNYHTCGCASSDPGGRAGTGAPDVYPSIASRFIVEW